MRVNGAWSLTNPTMLVKTSLLRRMGSPFSEAATVVFVSPKWRPTFRTFRWSCRTDRPRPCRVRPDRGAATADFLDGVFGAAFLLELMLCLLENPIFWPSPIRRRKEGSSSSASADFGKETLGSLPRNSTGETVPETRLWPGNPRRLRRSYSTLRDRVPVDVQTDVA